MRRVRQLPIETVIAISLLAVALLAGAGVVVRAAVSPEPDRTTLASAGGAAPDPPATSAPPAPVDGATSTTTTRRPADSGGQPTATTATPATPTTGPARPGGALPAECTELMSETFWRRTGTASPLEAPAGASADYAEVVTNRGDERCRLVASRCDAAATLLTVGGTVVDAPSSDCESVVTEVVLRPGERWREDLTVAFPVPPGEYRVQVSRYDGTTAVLPVLLDDRLPPCAAGSLSATVDEGDVFRRLEDVSANGLDVDLVVAGAEAPCTLRVTESRVTLAQDDHEVEVVDATERWSALEPGAEVRTHADVAPTELQPGDHEAVVTLVLADGTELEAPFRLLLG